MKGVLPVRFDRDGLIPVVTQDAASGEVLMLAFMNEEALQRTRDSGFVHYWSRSRDALWLKGETSGNRQQLVSMHVNCEQNSILLKVVQQGAVCHDGFDTCFYRSIDNEGCLHVDRDRSFDPVEVYGKNQSESVSDRDPLRAQFGAYEFLRDHDLIEVSSTSRRLRSTSATTLMRVGDELRELAAVIAGEHLHQDTVSDIILESSQVTYWVLVSSLGAGFTWQDIRPDVALDAVNPEISDASAQTLLRQFAEKWIAAATNGLKDGALPHATIALVGQVCRLYSIDPIAPVAADLVELRKRSYLDDFFSARANSAAAL